MQKKLTISWSNTFPSLVNLISPAPDTNLTTSMKKPTDSCKNVRSYKVEYTDDS